MVGSRVRVLVAAEYPAVRRLLSEVVREEPGVIVVGEAENSGRAIALAGTLRPDVALVDCNLPRAQGNDLNRLSRISGLDTAWAISDGVRNTQAVVLVNLSEAILIKEAIILAPTVSFQRADGPNTVAFTLGQLRHEDPSPANPVFANLQVEEREPARSKVAALAENILFVSALVLAGGLALIATLFLAPVGAAVALVGLGGLFLGLGVRAVASVWPKRSSHSRVTPTLRSNSYGLAQKAVLIQGTRNGSKNGQEQSA